MAARTNYTLWFAEITKIIFSETSKALESKLCWNVPLMVLHKMCFFYINRKSKMATITGHCFNIPVGPCGKMKKKIFQKLEIWLNPNWMWIITEWSLTILCVCVAIPNKYNLRSYGTNISKLYVYSYLKPVNHLKTNLARRCIGWFTKMRRSNFN